MNRLLKLVHKHLRSLVVLTGSVSLMCLFLITVLDISDDMQFVSYVVVFCTIAITNHICSIFRTIK